MLPLPIMAMPAIMAASMHKHHTTSSWKSNHSSKKDENEKEDKESFEELTEEEKAIRRQYMLKVREIRKHHIQRMFLEDH